MVHTRSQKFAKLFNFSMDYWKLEAKDAEYEKLAAVNRDMLSQRGLLDYHKCSGDELQRFYQQRKLATRYGDGNGLVRDRLVARLQHADNHATFDKFLALPAELRVTVYQFHINSLSRTNTVSNTDLKYSARPNLIADFNSRLRPTIRAQPPITRVSRLLRKESLPEWYRLCQFGLLLCDADVSYTARGRGIRRRLMTVCSIETTAEARRFFARAPLNVIESITDLSIHIEGPRRDRDGRYGNYFYDVDPLRFRIVDLSKKVKLECDVDEKEVLARDLSANTTDFLMYAVISSLNTKEATERIRERRRYVRRRAEFFRKAMAARGDKLKLRSSDLADLLTLFNQRLKLS